MTRSMDRRVSENIVDSLVDDGLVRPRDADRAIEKVHELTKGDYIPDGGPTRKVKNKRRAPAGHRCGCVTGNDVQSGPFYCGAPAAWMADDAEREGFILFVCAGHEKRLDRHL